VVNQLGAVEISIDLVQVALHGKGIGLRKVHRDGRTWSRVVPRQKHPAPGINELTKALKETKVFTKVFTTKDGDFANVPLNQL
jgi:hypothetical protein